MKIHYKYLRKKKAESLEKVHSSNFYYKDSLSVETYDNATIFPLRRCDQNLLFGCSGVTDENGNYIESSGIKNRVFGKYDFRPGEYRDQVVVWAGFLVDHWGHFLIEAVARLWFALQNNEHIDKYIFTVEDGAERNLCGNYREFIRYLGILDKVEIINKPITFKRVFIPELSYSRNEYYSSYYKQIFQTVTDKCMEIDTKDISMDENVFFSRSKFPKATKTEFGLDMLDNFFQNNKFTIIFPEQLSLSEMVKYINLSKSLFMESGTLPHNLLFAQDGKKVTILERQVTVNEIQSQIDIIKSLNVIYIDAHYSLYPVSAGYGPFFLAYNKYFLEFSNDFCYQPPDDYFKTEKYLKKQLGKYLEAYTNNYGYTWGLDKWQLQYADDYYEAYYEAYSIFSDYLLLNKIPSYKLFFNSALIKKSLHKIKNWRKS